jgi:N-acetylglucosamine malate deacetylase 1
MIDLKNKRALILAPHTDDGELGCGATIAKLLEENTKVFYVAFSACEESVPSGYEENELVKELHAAMAVLGVEKDNITIHNYPVRHFKDHRQNILQDIIDQREKINPNLIFMPCLGDIHQDHQVIAAEGLRAYKGRSILSYELPWNNVSFNTSAFIKLDKRHIDQKAAALAEYKTQEGRPYTNKEFLFSLARTRGVQIGSTYAEAFELVRLVI